MAPDEHTSESMPRSPPSMDAATSHFFSQSTVSTMTSSSLLGLGDGANAGYRKLTMQNQYNALFNDPAYRSIREKLSTLRRSTRRPAPDAGPPPKASFIDVSSTGMRLAYYDYGSSCSSSSPSSSPASPSSNVILLLHDVGTSAAVWHEVATALAGTGAYRVICLDSRGHGRSTWGCDGSSYGIDALAKDVHGFIVEKGLYVRPVCVFGVGMGGLVGLTLAGMGGRKLVGAVGVVEGGVVVRDGGSGKGTRDDGDVPTTQPWVGTSLLGPSDVSGSGMHVGALAGWLMSPLSGVGPRVVREATRLVEGNGKGEDLDAMLEYTTGDETRCIQLARALLREGRGAASPSATVLRADPAFALQFSTEQLEQTMGRRLDMHVLFMFGAHSMMWSRQDVCALSSLCTNAASVTVEELPDKSSRFVRDDPEDTADALLEYVVYSATGCFDVGSDGRTPEDLGLRPLDEFDTLEAAQKALGPRKVPTRGAIEEALRALRVAEGRDADALSSDEETDGREGTGAGTGSATGLCQDDKNYFGFVG